VHYHYMCSYLLSKSMYWQGKELVGGGSVFSLGGSDGGKGVDADVGMGICEC